MTGRVNSFQSLGAVDGPGIRYVVFFQGCNLRCGCCHNPETQAKNAGDLYTAREIVDRAKRYKEYFGELGGITLSGGEPILQSEFAHEIFSLAHKEGINTCLDTSGSVLNDAVKLLLQETDLVLLDIKYTSDDLYRKYCGISVSIPLAFLEHLNKIGKRTVIRRVIIPSLNDTKEDILYLKGLKEQYPCIENVELLPFKKICEVKYDNLKIPFPFKDFREPKKEEMEALNQMLHPSL